MSESDVTYPVSESTPAYEPIFKPWHRIFMSSVIIVFALLGGASIFYLLAVDSRSHMPSDLSAQQLTRDAAASERARAFVGALGFEPGPIVCRAIHSGSAWCTARVAGSDKTFALWCSWRHPTCIENLARE